MNVNLNVLQNVKATLERDGKQVVILLRSDDYLNSVKRGKLRWGSGRVWTVVKIEAAQ